MGSVFAVERCTNRNNDWWKLVAVVVASTPDAAIPLAVSNFGIPDDRENRVVPFAAQSADHLASMLASLKELSDAQLIEAATASASATNNAENDSAIGHASRAVNAANAALSIAQVAATVAPDSPITAAILGQAGESTAHATEAMVNAIDAPADTGTPADDTPVEAKPAASSDTAAAVANAPLVSLNTKAQIVHCQYISDASGGVGAFVTLDFGDGVLSLNVKSNPELLARVRKLTNLDAAAIALTITA